MADLSKLKDFQFFAENFFRIRTKTGEIKPFLLNKAQLYLHSQLEQQLKETGKVRAVILKGRQQGISTYIQARYFHKTITNRGIKTFILTHEAEATKNLFEMTKRYYEYLPDGLCPKAAKDSSKELRFDALDSGYAVGTAGNKGAGRSQTIQLCHCSEVGFYPHAEEHAQGLLQAIGTQDGTELVLESTANGIGNYFHSVWTGAEEGTNGFQAIFIPWYWQDEYTDDGRDFKPSDNDLELYEQYKDNGLTMRHIAWRRKKIYEFHNDWDIGCIRFDQEYPCIVGSQRVGTSVGLIPIQDVPSGYMTNLGCVLNQWLSGEKETIEVQTSLGYTLQCTHDHLIAIDSGFIEAAQSIGKSIKLSIPKFSENYCTITWRPFPSVLSSIEINEDWGLFLGYFMGDGSYSGETVSFAFTADDVESIHAVKSLAKKLLDLDLVVRETSRNGIELRAKNKKLTEAFLALEIINQDLDNRGQSRIRRKVSVPDCIWKSPNLVIKQFLRGLFDADGFADKHNARVMFFSKHEYFVKDVQLLLLGFGITSKRTHAQKFAGTDRHPYTGNELALRGSEARRFVEEISFVSQRKLDRINNWKVRSNSGRIAAPIIFKDEVISIEDKGIQKVYDLEMDNDDHVFDANGFVVHNCSSAIAFTNPVDDTFIHASHVVKARKTKVESEAQLIIGVDPAIGDNDRCAIVRRRGRKAYDIEVLRNHNTMELAGRLKTIIERERPAKVCIDCIGIGAGVTDRLLEQGFSCVEGVNVARSANDKERFANLRAELWSEMRDWLTGELPVDVPDNDELHRDLCGLGYKHKSNGQLLIESKIELKKRGFPSCDLADALMLTFYFGQHGASGSYQPIKPPDNFNSMFT